MNPMADTPKQFTLPKPSKAPRRMKNHHYSIAYMNVAGVKTVQIAKELNLSHRYIDELLNTPELKDLCQKIHYQMFGKDIKKRIEHIVPKAIDVNEKLMMDETVKPSVRKDIASDFMDRHLGKATQTIDVQSSSIRELITALKERDAKKIVDSLSSDTKNQAVDADFKELPLEASPEVSDDRDDVQKWVDENFTPGAK